MKISVLLLFYLVYGNTVLIIIGILTTFIKTNDVLWLLGTENTLVLENRFNLRFLNYWVNIMLFVP